MGEDRILLSELGLLLLAFAGPVYLIASIAQAAVLAGAAPREHRLRTILVSVLVSLLLAFPLTVLVWWLTGLLPAEVFSWLTIPISWEPPFSGGVLVLPALVASLIAYTLVGLFVLRRSRTRP